MCSALNSQCVFRIGRSSARDEKPGQRENRVLLQMDWNAYQRVSSGTSDYTKVNMAHMTQKLHSECMAWCLTCTYGMCRGRQQHGRLHRRPRPTRTLKTHPRKAFSPFSICSCPRWCVRCMFTLKGNTCPTV